MMKTTMKKSGFALLTILFIMTALSLTLGMLIQIGTQRSFDARRLTDRAKALAYAEAGVDYAYAILSADFDQRDNPSAFSLDGGTNSSLASAQSSSIGVESSYSEGSFSITVTSISNRYAIISSEGNCGSAAQTAEVVIEDIYAGSGGSGAIDYGSMDGFNYAMLSGGEFDFKGSGFVGGASKMHSNSAIDINGSADAQVNISSSVEISVGNNTVNGSITAPSLDLHNNASIAGGSTSATVPPVSIPDIDFTPYYNWASSHGEVESGDLTINSDYTPDGGILYVIGDVLITGTTVFNGSIIATGDIKISGQAQIRPSIDSIAMASGSGNIENTSSGRITGLIYSKSGNYKQTSNGELYGQIIIGGEIQKGGNSDIVFFQQSIPTPPGISSVTPKQSLPVIAGWQK